MLRPVWMWIFQLDCTMVRYKVELEWADRLIEWLIDGWEGRKLGSGEGTMPKVMDYIVCIACTTTSDVEFFFRWIAQIYLAGDASPKWQKNRSNTVQTGEMENARAQVLSCYKQTGGMERGYICSSVHWIASLQLGMKKCLMI